MNDMTFDECRAEILDTIEVCKAYLADAKAHESKSLGPFGHLFDAEGIAFAKAQIDFELDRLAELDASMLD
jgi:hypothetical protein